VPQHYIPVAGGIPLEILSLDVSSSTRAALVFPYCRTATGPGSGGETEGDSETPVSEVTVTDDMSCDRSIGFGESEELISYRLLPTERISGKFASYIDLYFLQFVSYIYRYFFKIMLHNLSYYPTKLFFIKLTLEIKYNITYHKLYLVTN